MGLLGALFVSNGSGVWPAEPRFNSSIVKSFQSWFALDFGRKEMPSDVVDFILGDSSIRTDLLQTNF